DSKPTCSSNVNVRELFKNYDCQLTSVEPLSTTTQTLTESQFDQQGRLLIAQNHPSPTTAKAAQQLETQAEMSHMYLQIVRQSDFWILTLLEGNSANGLREVSYLKVADLDGVHFGMNSTRLNNRNNEFSCSVR